MCYYDFSLDSCYEQKHSNQGKSAISDVAKIMTNDASMEAVFTYICRYWQQFGFGPSLREIAEGCFMSRPNVYRYLDRLENEGRITRIGGRARSIALVEDCPDPYAKKKRK